MQCIVEVSICDGYINVSVWQQHYNIIPLYIHVYVCVSVCVCVYVSHCVGHHAPMAAARWMACNAFLFRSGVSSRMSKPYNLFKFFKGLRHFKSLKSLASAVSATLVPTEVAVATLMGKGMGMAMAMAMDWEWWGFTNEIESFNIHTVGKRLQWLDLGIHYL